MSLASRELPSVAATMAPPRSPADTPAGAISGPSWLNNLRAMLAKELLLEWRNLSRLGSVALFGAVTLVLFSFVAPPQAGARRMATAGFLVLALLLSSTLSLSESFRKETHHRALTGLLLVPVAPSAIFIAKAFANFFQLVLLAPVLIPVALVLFSVDLTATSGVSYPLLQLLAVWALASAGLAAPGTLYAAMTSDLRGRDVVLPLLFFPLVVPVLLAAVKATALVLSGDAMGQLGSWNLLLLIFAVVHGTLGTVLFGYAVEES